MKLFNLNLNFMRKSIGVLFLLSVFVACGEMNDLNLNDAELEIDQILTEEAPSENLSRLPPVLDLNSCGVFFNENYGVLGDYHIYPDKVLNFCDEPGGTVYIALNAVDVPNKFTVYDANGLTVASTGWIGNANYSGPWGSSLSGSGTTILSFLKKTSTYLLRVETATFNMADKWEATVTCKNVCQTEIPCDICDPECESYIPNNPDCDPIPCDECDPDCELYYPNNPNCDPVPPACTVSDCGMTRSGNFGGVGYHTYPNEELTFCPSDGSTLTFIFEAIDVPNRFMVYDSTGSLVAQTSWLGESTQFGYWGAPFSGPFTQTISIPRNSLSYSVRIETVTSNRADAWEFHLSCQ